MEARPLPRHRRLGKVSATATRPRGGRAMRAVLCKEFAGPEKLVLADVPLPPLRDGTVRIVIHAAGVNFADTLLITGQYQDKPPLPYSPGMEVACDVAEAGASCSPLKSCARVPAPDRL